MPADAPPGLVPVPLNAGRTANISRPLKGWPEHVRLEVSFASGIAEPPVLYEKWPIGSPTGRRQLEREAMLAPGDIQRIDQAAAQFRQAHLDYEESIKAGERHQQQAAFDREATLDTDFGLMNIEVWTSGQTDARTTFAIQSVRGFIDLCNRTQINGKMIGDDVFIGWPKIDWLRLCILDVDFHVLGLMPTLGEIAVLKSLLAPSPACIHDTSRGFHAIFGPFGGIPANELAAAAAALLMTSPTIRSYRGTVEILTRSRHPKSTHNGRTYGPIALRNQDDSMPVLQVFDRISCSDGERDEVLSVLGLRLGDRLPHSDCPMEPHHRSSAVAPVVVGEHGVFCWSCEGRTGNGFISWGALRRLNKLPTQATGETTVMRDAIVHWTPHAHVDRLFEALVPGLPSRWRKPLHQALLRRHHRKNEFRTGAEIDAMVTAVMAPFPYVRNADSTWCHADTLLATSPRLGRAALSSCSAALRPTVDDEDNVVLKPDLNLVTRLETDGTVPGFFPIVPTVLSPIWHIHHPSMRTGCFAVKPTASHRDPLRYLASAERMPLEDARQLINQRFPGIDWNYLTLLHVARGWGEEGVCQLPMIWATGETSTGKTSHVWVECAMHDEIPENLVIPHDDIDGISDKVAAAQGRTGFIMLDDFCKNLEGRMGLQRRNNITTFLLQYNRAVNYHAMYVGEKVRTITTPLVMTDMRHPAELTQHDQIGRRVIMAQLHQPVSWDKNGKASGFLGWWRDAEMRKAAETWHSWIVDTYFGEDPPSFVTVARQLGYALLRDVYGQTDDAGHRETLIRQFVQAILRKPEASGVTAEARDQRADQLAVTRARGPGWVIISDQPGPLEEAAAILCHSLNYEFIAADGLKKALEPYQTKLHQLMPFNDAVRVDIEGWRQTRVIVRVRAVHRTRPMKIGEQLLTSGATANNMLDADWTQES